MIIEVRPMCRTGRLTITIPEIMDPNEIVIVYTTEHDDFGRRQFFAFWLDNVGARCDQRGVRGQVFYTNSATFIARVQKPGRTIREIHLLG